MTERVDEPPRKLSAEAKKWWRRITTSYEIDDDAARLLLQTALEAFDRCRQCSKRIDADGVSVEDRFGIPKPHPLLNAERDARAQMLATLKALNLDLEPLRASVGRPTR